MKAIVVRSYASVKAYERDCTWFAKKRYAVANVETFQQRRSIAGLLFTPFALFRGKRVRLVVTYMKVG